MKSKEYILLLRGINVGGNNKVSMKELKELLEKGGFTEVTTYINSGNVIFHSDCSDLAALKKSCEAMLLDRFKLELNVVVLEADELLDALRHAPEWWDADSESKHNAIFVIPPATVEDVFAAVGEAKPEFEKVDFYHRVIFWSAPKETFSKTRWSAVAGSSIYNSLTIRNSNTVKKLALLCEK